MKLKMNDNNKTYFNSTFVIFHKIETNISVGIGKAMRRPDKGGTNILKYFDFSFCLVSVNSNL